MVSRSARLGSAVVGGGVTRLKTGVDEAQVEVGAEAEAKRVASVTLPFEGVASAEGVERSFENNLSISDPAPLMVSG
jgi:hypothetical protein